MMLGNQVEWALHCMTVLGRMPENVHVSAKLLAEFHGVPKEYLSKAMQALANAGLVNTTSGPKGGYSLSRAPSKITVLDIVEAVEGTKVTFNCQEIRGNIPCKGKPEKPTAACTIASVMYKADNAWRDVLRKQKLSDMIQAVDKVVPEEAMEYSNNWLLEKI